MKLAGRPSSTLRTLPLHYGRGCAVTEKAHRYEVDIAWTGNRGAGTTSYRGYGRDHDIDAPGAPTILGTSSPAYRGDPTRWNPEQLQVAALSQCHMLWYLHLASINGVVLTAYRDHPVGDLRIDVDGGGEFDSVTLHPHVTITSDSDPTRARDLHAEVPALCFIARSVRFPVLHEPTITSVGGSPS